MWQVNEKVLWPTASENDSPQFNKELNPSNNYVSEHGYRSSPVEPSDETAAPDNTLITAF